VSPATTSNFVKSGVMAAGASKTSLPKPAAEDSTPATTSNFLKSGICVATPVPTPSTLPATPSPTSPAPSAPETAPKPTKSWKRRQNKKKNQAGGEGKYEPVPVPKMEEMMKVYSVGMAAAD
jgi:hypothetical protein